MKFDIAFKHLMDNEGGFSDDPVDIGGKTIYGIASRYHKAWFDLVYKAYKSGDIKTAKKLTEQFYKNCFWHHKYEDIIDSSLAFRLFDFGANAGVRKAVKIFQKSINFFWTKKLKTDGVFGRLTLAKCNRVGQEKLYLLYTIKIYLYYITRPTKWKHLRGWTLRLLKRHWLT